MDGKALYVLILVANCAVAAVAQVFLKKASLQNCCVFFRQYFNLFVICGYFLFFCVVFVNVFLLKFLPMFLVCALGESLPLVFSFFNGRLFFGEKMTVAKVVGGTLILSGVFFTIV